MVLNRINRNENRKFRWIVNLNSRAVVIVAWWRLTTAGFVSRRLDARTTMVAAIGRVKKVLTVSANDNGFGAWARNLAKIG